ncbi:MAG TPA: NAD(P)/FAD-dependent oxidoreductase, partial [Ilumatobacteraceae bacterium]
MPDVDVIVVGAGPAGSCAALTLARAGRSVTLIERGPFPGSKNMFGGVVYPRVLDDLLPNWWEEAPVQRWITRRATMLMTPTQALTIDYRTTAWGSAPYNGMTTFRPDFDSWLAGRAEAEGAQLICSTTVTGLLREADGRVVGVRTDRP